MGFNHQVIASLAGEKTADRSSSSLHGIPFYFVFFFKDKKIPSKEVDETREVIKTHTTTVATSKFCLFIVYIYDKMTPEDELKIQQKKPKEKNPKEKQLVKDQKKRTKYIV
jgi:hypothetical protein